MVKVSLIYAGHQIDYLYGLISGFDQSHGIKLDVIDSNRFDKNFCIQNDRIRILKFLDTKGKSVLSEALRWVKYYLKLTLYLLNTDSKVIHIEWINRKIDTFEHLYFPLIKFITRKKIVFKVHDLDTNILLKGGNKNHDILKFTNRFFLKNVDCIITHNKFVKSILIKNTLKESKIKIINHGINNYQSFSKVSRTIARKRLNITDDKKVLLFFGNIRAYKGLDFLLEICLNLHNNHKNLHLIVAGKNDIKDRNLNKKIERLILKLQSTNAVSYFPGFVSDINTQLYFNAADVLILPYKFIYQSGLPFLSFAAGIPVISSDAGGIKENINNFDNGYVVNLDDLQKTIEQFLIGNLSFSSSDKIIKDSSKNYSWKTIAERKINLYRNLT